ncbi:MAG TPA: matrixin family metalloprotease [bacterium]|nr:matrixin family metalloprotease [bacterium]
MNFLKKFLPPLLLLWLLFCLVYFFQNELTIAWHRLDKKISPCGEPILYSLGAFDAHFDLDQSELQSALSEAENVWEIPLQKNLFDWADSGVLKINLVYDARQDSTLKLQKLGLQINNDNATYDALKVKYDSLIQKYAVAKKQLNEQTAYYNQQKNIYEQAVKEANKRGGAAPEEYTRLEADRASLNTLVTAIQSAQSQINEQVENINAVANVVNRLVKELNLNVNTYNTVDGESSGEFQTGEYVSDSAGERINIYQFDNQDELVSLLAHELGHALGLEHVDNPDALMYRLEQNGNSTATDADLSAARSICRIK